MISLPVDAVLPALAEALTHHRAAILTAPPGSGKTTRAPAALLDRGVAGGRAVVVLQPRRVAARLVARRIAEERGTPPGEEIGWRVRFEDVTSPRTRLVVLTEGLLTRRLQTDPFLEDVGLVVLDEFHERSLHADLALALLAEVQATRSDLKILVMSATLDPAPLVRFFDGDCPVITAEGRPFPVAIRFAPRPDERPLPLRCALAIQQALQEQPQGHVLAFLPGVAEIERTREALLSGPRADGTLILPLHGRLRSDEQDRALAPSPPGTRKVVLATNIAETSVTLEGVTAVVDSGQQRTPRFDPVLGLERLEAERISLASAEQRAGRAGRTGPGTCYRLWTENEHRLLRPHDPPEIHRADLAATALEVLAWGADPHTFGWLQPPPAPLLQRALDLLQTLGAVDAQSRLTPTGRRLVLLPVHPRLGRILLAAHSAGCLRAAATAAALISERDPFPRRELALPAPPPSLLDRIQQIQQGGQGADPRALQQVRQVRDQLIAVAETACGRADLRAEADESAIIGALIEGFPERVGQQRAADSRRYLLASGRGARLDVGQPAPPYLIAVELTAGEASAGETLIRACAPVHPASLPATTETCTRFDPEREGVVCEDIRRYGALILSSRPAAAPPDVEEAARLLAAAALAAPSRALPWTTEVEVWLARLRWLAHHRPALGLPTFPNLAEILPALCVGRRSFADLQRLDLRAELQGRLTWPQQQALHDEAPEHWPLPSGASGTITYGAPEDPPVLAARIQQLFGMTETPRLAGGRVPVRVHLLAPNNRPVQVTSDLGGFWTGSYAEVRKDLRGRYPKHAWPERPTRADAEDRPRRRGP